jgi:WXG100 family type VII secretion target
MNDILITPPVLRSTSAELKNHAQRVKQCLQKVDSDIQALAPVRFEGNRANSLRNRYRSTREKIFTWPELLTRFSQQLMEIADVFEKVDRNAAGVSGDPSGAHFIKPSSVAQSQTPISNPTPAFSENGLVTRIDYDKNAPVDDCYKFVMHHRSEPKSGYGNYEGGFYTGIYKGQSGSLPSGNEYGQEPKIGSIMVESPSGTNGITYGHVSYVVEVTKDPSGNVMGYKIAEGSWPKGHSHEETFYLNADTNQFVSSTGTRSPDMFIY